MLEEMSRIPELRLTLDSLGFTHAFMIPDTAPTRRSPNK
jgi:hypothetical protein